MCYKFHTIIETAVTLDVYMLLLSVGDNKQFIGIFTVFTCSVNLQFYAKISLRIAIEYGFRFVPVIMDGAVLIHLIMITVTAIVITVKMVGVIFV